MKRIVLVTLTIITSAFATWQNPTPVCTAPGDQENFLALPYADGGVLVLWEDYRNGDADIYAQALDADGNALWQENGVPVVTETGGQIQPDAVVLESGDVVVTWDDGRVAEQHSVYAQRLRLDGSLKWNADGVPVHVSQSSITDPHLCPSGDGAIVEWRVRYQVLKARRILGNGDVVWPDTGINICAGNPGDIALVDLVTDARGGTIITYLQAPDFRVQRVDSLANLVWGDSGIWLYTWIANNLIQMTSQPSLMSVPDDSGGAIVQWKASQSFAQHVDSSGVKLWGDTGVVVAPYIDDFSCLTADGIYLVRGGIGSGFEAVYAHKLTLTGETPWGYEGKEVWNVWAYDPREFIYPYVTEDGIIVWRDVYDEGDPWGDRYEERGILAQRIDTMGNVLWSEEVLVCGTTGSNPLISSTYDKAGIIMWQDNRHGNIDLYATRIDSLGNLPPGIGEHPSPTTLTLIEVTELSALRLTLSHPAGISMDVYDVGGRRVITFGTQRYEAGTQPITLDTQTLAGGIYFVRLNIKPLGGESQTQWAKITVVK